MFYNLQKHFDFCKGRLNFKQSNHLADSPHERQLRPEAGWGGLQERRPAQLAEDLHEQLPRAGERAVHVDEKLPCTCE